MTGLAVKIPDDFDVDYAERVEKSSTFGTQNALARLARRTWPQNTVKETAAAWGLTIGEARGVVYATASQATIDKIKRHRNGGWRVTLALDALVIGQRIEDFIIEETERSRERMEIRQRRHRRLETLCASLDALGGGTSA